MKNTLFCITLLCTLLLVGCIGEGNPNGIDTSKINIDTVDLSGCFEDTAERNYQSVEHIEITEKLEYIVEDEVGNYLQDLVIWRYKSATKASGEVTKGLTDPSCQHKTCENANVQGYNAAKIKTEWELRKEQGEASYSTEYVVAINDLLISSIGNGYTWDESENYAKSAIDCVISAMSD